MKKFLIAAILLTAIKAGAQNYILKAGDKFPNIVIGPIINAPITELNLNKYQSNKLFVINLWGTWCSPCIPEMDSLAKLQSKFGQHIQVIGLSNEPIGRIKKYLAKKPSKIWLATDTASLLYQMLNLAYVGQCVVVNAKHEIVAILKTDSVNTKIINRLIKGEKVKSNGQVQNRLNSTDKDPFGVDSLLASNFTIRSYMTDHRAMGKKPNSGVFGGRRITYFNVGVLNMYQDAYKIVSSKQIVYEGSTKKYDNYEDKNLLYCFDLLVKPEQKDSLYIIMQQRLQQSMPVKARIELRNTDVYVLKLKEEGKVILPSSKLTALTYGFSGQGFDGKGATLADFSDLYLSNEFNLPVIDETGLAGRYDIKTNVEMRTKEGLLKSIDDIGFRLEKTRRKIRIMVLYTNQGNL
ncbi:soil-associated protein, TIGR03435 family [Mucilaginibacter pineti]|uniref:Soil-associated protein, TIGR03435 family n=1 Tax=Mucilaginibacter pineti TaxID=1391627 RepID=A0A1G7AI57_9SPHI|nr:redoxin family protein [Mucilaginibacter pineti]SDE14393.1 soil-associated protein, TIGR03435 family [Mucilaginibacter pineti]